MSKWEEYKQTARVDNPIFNLARAGDLEGLKALITTSSTSMLTPMLEEKDSRGSTALMLAAYHGHEEVTRVLLEAGADPNSHDLGGNSILMGAVFKGHVEIVRLLLAYGANPKATNAKGMIALGFARMFGRTEVLQLLKEQSA